MMVSIHHGIFFLGLAHTASMFRLVRHIFDMFLDDPGRPRQHFGVSICVRYKLSLLAFVIMVICLFVLLAFLQALMSSQTRSAFWFPTITVIQWSFSVTFCYICYIYIGLYYIGVFIYSACEQWSFTFYIYMLYLQLIYYKSATYTVQQCYTPISVDEIYNCVWLHLTMVQQGWTLVCKTDLCTTQCE